jgi:peptide/nickel transport system ATP-binding protein
MAALNPSLRIGRQLTEVLVEHKMSRGVEAKAECIRMLDRVKMPDPPAMMERYPHQLSGGQQQRVLIAMALLTNPALLILDEPTTGLDVTVEAGILDLIAELKHEFDSTILYISHNLGVITRVADRVAVMYAGELVEQSSVRDIFLGPQHPYTVALFRCIPKISASRQIKTLQPIRGKVPSLHETPSGCIFEPRCDRARERCRLEHPDIVRTTDEHLVRCFYAESPDPAELKALRAELADAEPSPRGEDPILKIEGLKTYYKAQESGLGRLAGRRKKGFVKAVDDINLVAWKKSTLGIVGESGCGKTTLAKCVAGLVSPNAGKMDFIGIDIARVVEQRPFELLKELQMIFQNPDSTLNPRRSVGETIARPLRLFRTVPSTEIMNEVVRLLEAVRLGEDYCDRLPRQLSGGERQRVALARAFAGRPALVLCDEPLSSLDVSVQAAVLNLLLEFQQEFGTAMLFISHDLSVVYQLCDNVAVMYLGQFCEIGPTEALFAPPYHPYTEALLSAVPIPDPTVERTNIRLTGTVPSALDPPSGCRFHTRCPRKIGPICERESPPWRGIAEGHRIYCHIDIEELRAVEPVFSTAY